MLSTRILTFLRLLLRRQRRLLLLLLIGLVLPWSVFLKAATEIREGEGFPGDQYLLRLAHAHATPALDRVFLLLTRLGGPPVMLLVSATMTGLLVQQRQRRHAWFFGVAVGGAAALNVAAKVLLGRARPALWVSLAPETTPSFPSGHAMGSAAVMLAIGLLLAHSRWRWLLWTLGPLFALGVGCSRIYLGVHYPSDVVAGWIAAVGWVTGVYLLFSPALHRLEQLWAATRA
ncbi:phosphatase PAP2 family protein [Hymenobacter jeollabukensis]|uniref:Phosphatase PAP2 family protein n=1 Tax=Hymenobacter jeollabukensis TaxID=2025313 RepID=A0A5R8WVE0_9BACT|nr:phosphatase PAP2 family protein [Hymenobacter jeollabukensis]TLM96490.1 phosphatase PAP2 family protein [Hymenobacter jeollabukensis]